MDVVQIEEPYLDDLCRGTHVALSLGESSDFLGSLVHRLMGWSTLPPCSRWNVHRPLTTLHCECDPPYVPLDLARFRDSVLPSRGVSMSERGFRGQPPSLPVRELAGYKPFCL